LAQARADAQAPSAAPRPRVGLRRAASSRSAAAQSQRQQQQFLLRHHRAKQERAARVAIVRASRSEGLPLQSAMTRALRASAAHRRHPAATWSMQCARMYACMQWYAVYMEGGIPLLHAAYMQRTRRVHAGAPSVWGGDETQWAEVRGARRGLVRQVPSSGGRGRTLQGAHACARTGKAR